MMEGNGQQTMDGETRVKRTVGSAAQGRPLADLPVSTGVDDLKDARHRVHARLAARPGDPRLVRTRVTPIFA
jgi:hypothetical protein